MPRILALFALGLTGSLSAATIGIVPTTTTVIPGTSFAVNVEIIDITDLYAFQFDLAFTPGILSATAITDGGFLATGFFPGFIDNTAGTVTFIADSLAGPVSGTTGSGTLASVQFLAVALGTSPISVTNFILLDSSLADIAANVLDSSVTVREEGAVVPEPATFALIAAGLLVLVASKNRRHW